jgi:two-component system, OmpR family, sensor histidine kinase BaeS
VEGLLDGVVEPSAETWAKLHGEAGRLRRLVDDLQPLLHSDHAVRAATRPKRSAAA